MVIIIRDVRMTFTNSFFVVNYLALCRPYTEETLEELGESGVKNLIVVPVSFVSEHIETLVHHTSLHTASCCLPHYWISIIKKPHSQINCIAMVQ